MPNDEAIEKAAQRAAELAIKAMLADYIPPTTEWLNTPQAAAYTGFSEEYLEIARHKDDGSGPEYIKHARAIRYHRDDLDAWMERNRHGRPREPHTPRNTRTRRAKAAA